MSAPVGSITIEATDDEVVSVEPAAESAPLASCLAEVAWALRLTQTFTEHRTYVVDL